MKAYKKILAGLMTAALAVPLTSFSASALVPQKPKGDINYDTFFNLSDIVMFTNWLHGKGKIADPSNADVNSDGSVDVFDLIAMRKILLGKINNASAKYENSGTVPLCAGLEQSDVELKKADDAFRTAQAQFDLELFKRTVKDNENVLVSPYSVMQALAMTANGADNETREDMEKALGGIKIEDLNKYLASWRKSQPNNENCKLLTANSVWIRDDEAHIKPQPQFIQNVVDYFNAEIFKAPFDDSTVKDINGWVNDHTDEMIPEIIDDLPDNAMMALVNAVTFDAKWDEPYMDYQVHPFDFTAYDGTVSQKDMLWGTEYSYLEGKNATGFLKYYQGRQYAFMAVLPDEDISITDYVNSLTVEDMTDLYQNVSHEKVITRMPKFKYEFGESLKETLKDMGMERAFDAYKADFYKMVTPDSDPLYIGDVIHKTFIELNESGTKAAAATLVEMPAGAAMEITKPKEVILDRPFVYAIVDTKAGLPVFMGTVMEINEE